MSAALTAEIVQWTILIGLALLVLALYRQVGLLIINPRELLTESFGPKIGQPAGGKLRRVLTDTAALKTGLHRLIVFVQDGCPSCKTLLQELTHYPMLMVDTDITLFARGSSDFQSNLSKSYPGFNVVDLHVVLDEREALDGIKLPGYPFMMLFDSQHVLRSKTIGGNLAGIFSSDVLGEHHDGSTPSELSAGVPATRPEPVSPD